jgi:hypothetical protein
MGILSGICGRATLSLGVLLGFVFWGFSEKKRMHIWVPSLDTEDIKNYV